MRLRVASDGKLRIHLMRDALVDRDEPLADRSLPTRTEEEIESYVWDLSNGRRKGEVPVDKDNHGMDCLRYLTAHVDELWRAGGESYLLNNAG